ncbi:hypothetical protein CO038_03210 [Candidatus Pacearchaeota archaeon CG_4_9_14_0_2_um_filter_39_13]|nr:ATP-binding protein [Candidatus Pacearchaeota archaeon]OIO42658.1 MAG: hypothetical protein AUJ64_03745 [Candidatus Pacearchaeota archaeon CG1_02_39_14]PJC44575.1 MAG: hypothetical protein CO038_03210 [Candidatus Pacearchaeota archaeon CG_4_9_14_0_2_um_filter_39_13]
MKSKFYVLTGACCTGKTTLINELSKLGYETIREGTETYASEDSGEDFDRKMFEYRKKQMDLKKDKGTVFCDRGLIDTIAYYKIRNRRVPSEFIEHMKKVTYEKVFILGDLGFYRNTSERKMLREEQKEFEKKLIDAYQNMGYEIEFIPKDTTTERLHQILSFLD